MAIIGEAELVLLCKRIVSLLAILFGLVGVVGCLFVLGTVWVVQAKLQRTTENVFQEVDNSIALVQGRFVQVQSRVEAAKITTADIEQSLKEWTTREAGQRLGARLEIAEKTERLAGALDQAEHWLELSESSVKLVQQGLVLGNSAGAPVDPGGADKLIVEVASLRDEVAEAQEFVAGIGERMSGQSDEKLPRERLEQAVQLTLRVIATLGMIDSQLAEFETALTQTQSDLRGVQSKTQSWILAIACGIALLTAWMGAGQFALCVWGWRGLRRTASD